MIAEGDTKLDQAGSYDITTSYSHEKLRLVGIWAAVRHCQYAPGTASTSVSALPAFVMHRSELSAHLKGFHQECLV